MSLRAMLQVAMGGAALQVTTPPQVVQQAEVEEASSAPLVPAPATATR